MHGWGSHLLPAPTHAHPSAHWHLLTAGTVTSSSETLPEFEVHEPQIAFAQFPLIIFSFLCLHPKPKGHAHSCRLSPPVTRIRKANVSGEKAKLRSPGFSAPLAQLTGSRWSTSRLLQPGPEEGTLRLDSAALGKLNGPTWAWVKMELKKWAAIGYLYIWVEWLPKPPQPAWEGLKARQRLLNASGES